VKINCDINNVLNKMSVSVDDRVTSYIGMMNDDDDDDDEAKLTIPNHSMTYDGRSAVNRLINELTKRLQ